MKSFQDYISESQLLDLLEYYRGSEEDIDLPYTFDIYNKGAKNTDFKITKLNIRKVFFRARSKGTHFEQMIRVPLPANMINYREVPNAKNTDNWTKIPEIREYMYCGGWYSDKWQEYGYSKWNRDWTEYLTGVFKELKGKVSVTATEDNKDADFKGWSRLVFTINDDKFNKDREEKIKELKDPKHLKEWKDQADAAEKKRIEDQKKKEEEKKKAEEEWNKWWDSLSDSERLSWSMGYGRGSGSWTGD